MLTFHSFRNADPPLLAALWRSRSGQPGLSQPVSPELLEQLVFAKLYFDYDGLILARDDGRLVGFAHAGFGPNEERSWISTASGITCLVLTGPGCDEDRVAGGLLERCEEYLKNRGAKLLLGGGLGPLSPFYVGLYGGSELPGVLDSDLVARRAFESRGYREVERTVLMHRELSEFEAIGDRRQMQIRRQTVFEATADAPTRSWWEACLFGEYELTRFDLKPQGGGPAVASATFRSAVPEGASAERQSVGLIDIHVAADYRRGGLARFLLNNAFRWFLRRGIVSVAVQAPESDAYVLTVFSNLGFSKVEQGGLWRKEA